MADGNDVAGSIARGYSTRILPTDHGYLILSAMLFLGMIAILVFVTIRRKGAGSATRYVARLKSLHDEGEVAFRANPGAREADLAAAERELGFPIDGGLRELWQICNGAHYETTFFRVISDEATPCRFLSVEEAVKEWRDQTSLVADEIEHDERIASGRGNARWLPFAEFNGFSTCVMVDRAPAPGGRDGQIIVYQHDPDAMYVAAETFKDFLARSIQILREEDFVE